MSTDAIRPLRQRMIEDMSARKLNPHMQRSHIISCKRFAVYLNRSPDTATVDEILDFGRQQNAIGESLYKIGRPEEAIGAEGFDARACSARLDEDSEQYRRGDLKARGARNGTVRLEEAIAFYRAALEELTRERVPLDWARTEKNLDQAISLLAQRRKK